MTAVTALLLAAALVVAEAASPAGQAAREAAWETAAGGRLID